MDKEQELRPCPLCNAALSWDGPLATFVHPFDDCHLSGHFVKVDEVSAWNRRSPDEQAEVVGWRAVPGFGDKYEVSSSGQLRRADTLALRSPTRSGDGYLKVDLWHQNSRRQVLLHRLVAEAFVPRPEGADEVNHLDGNKHNNAAGNLEWTDRRGNVDHFQYQLGKTVRPVLAISPDGSDTYYPSIEAAGRDGFNAKLISHVLNGHKKTHAGKRWVYTAFRSSASPPSVAKGGVTVTDAMVEAAQDVLLKHVEDRAAIRSALTAALAVGDEGIRPDLLAEMAKHPGWSIDRGYRDRGGDEDDPYGWCVHEVRGGRNDREWDLIGFGETPHEALSAAIAGRPTPPSRGEGE